MKIYRTKDWLHDKYVVQQLTLQQIAEEVGVQPTTIHLNLVRLEIPRRHPGLTQWSDEVRAKITKALKGKKPMLGKTHSEETKRAMSASRAGSGNSNWKGGKTVETRHFRKSRQYQQWRLAVLKRDDFKCQYEGCNKPANTAHHKKPIRDYPESKLDVSNGMAVCSAHHNTIHKSSINGS